MGIVEAVWSQASWPRLLLCLLAAYVLSSFARRKNENRRIRATGGAFPRRHWAWLPWGMDLAIRSMRAVSKHRVREQWSTIFARMECDTTEFRVAGRRIIFTQDPENIKALLATQFSDFGKGNIFHEEWHEFLGDSIFTTDGAQWHASRQLLRPQFVKDRVSDLKTFEQHLQVLFTAMAVGGDPASTATALQQARATAAAFPSTALGASASGRRLEMSDLFFRYTLDVATDFLLGKDTESLTTPHQKFAIAFNEVQHVQGLISRTGPFNRLVPRGAYHRGLRVIDEFVNHFIDRALLLPPEELEKGQHRYTFLHELARFTRDRKVLRDQLIAVLLAGRDTTAATLSWAIYELARHPECLRLLRAEIAAVVGLQTSPRELPVDADPHRADASGDHAETTVPASGPGTAPASGYRLPTYADLKGMRYLQHVLNETLRLYPAVPFNVRLTLHDTTLPRGGGPDGSLPVGVLKGTPVGYSALLLHRRPDLMPQYAEPSASSATSPPGRPVRLAGPDEFSPERWDHWQPKPWLYIPFNGGPRICIGQQFALAEMGYVLVRMFQKFERLDSHMFAIDGGKPTLRTDVVIQPADGVHVTFYEPTVGEKGL